VAAQRLGQHFLADAGWLRRIADASFGAAAARHGVWIEIGAGHGEMTELLAGVAERVVAIEVDRHLVPELTKRFAAQPNVTVVAGDVLDLDLAELAGAPQFSIYGNLPYYITSPIVHRILGSGTGECGAALREAYLVMQMEVAERLAAPAGGGERGYFSAFTQFYATPEILLRIPPGAFRPPPKVQSALVRLRPPGARLGLGVGVADEAGFVDFLKTCFAQKRKTLRNNLRKDLPGTAPDARGGQSRADQVLREAGIAPDARAEQLSLSELATLFATLRHKSAAPAMHRQTSLGEGRR
jgi:16S rRNA (adenine1518-N6/adenine1519-N6)-dimethyltransferase